MPPPRPYPRALHALAGSTLLAALPVALPAQRVLDATVRVAPTVVTYSIGGGGGTISETVVPVAAVTPLGDRLTLDVASAYVAASARGGGATSSIRGQTDTQLRLNYTLGADAVVLTAGVNLPTGRYAVREAELAAAGQIGSDFLGFPVSSLGDGLAATAGVAVACPLGARSVGAAVAARHSAAFDAFEVAEGTVRFRPADEYRLRLGADRPLGGGHASLGVTYSAFGRDAAGPTTYGTGDRVVLQGSYARRVGDAELLVDAWSLYHAAGETAVGRAPWENVLDVAVAARWAVGAGSIEPNVELRDWRRDGDAAGVLAIVGVRGHLPLSGGLALLPSVGLATGRLSARPAASLPSAAVRGWQVSVALRR